MKGITFQATVNKVTTVVDGGWRVSFDVPQSESEAVLALAGVRDRVLQIGIVENSDLNAMRNKDGAWQEDGG